MYVATTLASIIIFMKDHKINNFGKRFDGGCYKDSTLSNLRRDCYTLADNTVTVSVRHIISKSNKGLIIPIDLNAEE